MNAIRPPLSAGTRVRIPQRVVSREVAGETVILELGRGHYYGLDEIGTRMFHLLVEHGTLGGALTALVREYEVSEHDLRADLLEFAAGLVDRDLLEVLDG